MNLSSETYLSTEWLEYFDNSNKDTQMEGVRKTLSKKLKPTANSKITVFNVGDAKNQCEKSRM